jgi:hypothetical protein
VKLAGWVYRCTKSAVNVFNFYVSPNSNSSGEETTHILDRLEIWRGQKKEEGIFPGVIV